jgi:uncharacterized protein Yka (UPF0111/DUF47 family)
MVTVTGAFADEIRSRTDTYLNQVKATTAHLPDIVDAYGENPDAFTAAVDRLNTQESECDATLRELNTLLGESLPPNYTDVYLRADDVVRLYSRIDAVPSRSERFARELVNMRPSLTAETRNVLREMGELVVEGTVILADLADAYVESLVTSGDPIVVADEVETVVELETACDGFKYDAFETAFADYETADALMVRELLLVLDAAMDAIEDAAEHLLSMQSVTH